MKNAKSLKMGEAVLEFRPGGHNFIRSWKDPLCKEDLDRWGVAISDYMDENAGHIGVKTIRLVLREKNIGLRVVKEYLVEEISAKKKEIKKK